MEQQMSSVYRTGVSQALPQTAGSLGKTVAPGTTAAAAGGTVSVGVVITSYSIHYTKLYEVCIDLETSFCDYMIQNAGLSVGTPGTVIDAWSDVAGQMSLMKAIGVPTRGQIYSVMNPYTIQNLASAQTGLSADPSRLVQVA